LLADSLIPIVVHANELYTVFQKNYTLFIFAITFFIREPICISFGSNMPEEKISVQQNVHCIFTTTPNLCAPTLPCNTSGKSD